MLILKLAFRNLFRNTRRTLLTCILVSSSLVALILVDGLVLGATDIMIGGITHTLEGEAQVYRSGFRDNLEADLYIENPEPIMATLAADAGVMGYAPRVLVGGMVASSYNTTGGLIYGVDYRQEENVSLIREAIIEGSYLTGGDREILIGKPMAELLEVEIGDRIILTAATVNTNDIAQELFRVSGIFEFGPDEMDETYVFINLPKAQGFLGMENHLHQIAIRFHDREDSRNRQLPLLQSLNQGNIEARGWLDLQPAFGAMIDMTNYSTAIVGAILFLLTSLGVINSMFMAIYERIYEFGVAKAIGTRPGQIISLVLVEALLLALLSCAAGIVIGYLANHYFSIHGVPMGEFEAAGVAIRGNVETRVALYQYINFPFYVTLLTLVAALYPAWFASRIVPTQALQRAL